MTKRTRRKGEERDARARAASSTRPSRPPFTPPARAHGGGGSRCSVCCAVRRGRGVTVHGGRSERPGTSKRDRQKHGSRRNSTHRYPRRDPLKTRHRARLKRGRGGGRRARRDETPARASRARRGRPRPSSPSLVLPHLPRAPRIAASRALGCIARARAAARLSSFPRARPPDPPRRPGPRPCPARPRRTVRGGEGAIGRATRLTACAEMRVDSEGRGLEGATAEERGSRSTARGRARPCRECGKEAAERGAEGGALSLLLA